jgi:hypothetical protein
MNRNICILLVVITCLMGHCGNLCAHVQMKDVFSVMPDSLLPYLTKNNRLDFIDFRASNMKAEVKNKFDEPCVMTMLTDNFLHIDLSKSSTLELKLLPVSDTTQIICMVNTYAGEEKESVVKFYTTSWQCLPCTDYLTLPVADDFFIRPDTMSVSDFNKLKKDVTPKLISAVLSDKDFTMVLSCGLPLLNKSEKKRYESILSSKKLSWNGIKFK